MILLKNLFCLLLIILRRLHLLDVINLIKENVSLVRKIENSLSCFVKVDFFNLRIFIKLRRLWYFLNRVKNWLHVLLP